MRSKALACLMIVVLLGSFFTASAFAAGPAPTGKLVALSAETFTGSWDPTEHTILANMHAEWNCFDRLVDVDLKTQEIIPRLATAWKWLSPTELQMTLRKNDKFHDGKVFDGKDVKASLEKWSNRKAVGSAWWAQQVTVDVAAADPYTVVIKAPKPYASLLNVLTYAHIMSADDIAKPDQLKSKMNGTGYFKFVKYENNAITYEANMDGWDGAPKVKEFIFQYMADPASRLAALQTGEANITERVESEQVPMIEADKKLALYKQLATEQKWLVYKAPMPPMDNVTVRQALSYAVDRESIVKDILQGFARLSESHLSPEQWGWASMPNLPTYDPKKAADLLTQAGYPGGKGLSGLKYFTSVGFYPKTKEYGEFIISNWNAVGVNVEFKPLEVASWLENLYQPKSMPIGDTGWMSPNLDPDMALVSLFRGPGQLCFIEDKDVDAALAAEGQESMDVAKRKELLQTKTLPVLADKVPQMPLFTSMLIYASTKDVEGFVPRATSMFDLKNVSVAAK